MAITTEQIFTVCDNLWAEGESPTNTKVRKVLGKGSFSTISKAIRDWKESRQPDEIATEAIELDPDTLLLVKRLITTIHTSLADSETTEQVSLLEGENENYQTLNADLTRENDELKGYKAAYDALAKRYEEAIRENENLRKGISPDNAELIEELSADRDRLDRENQQLKEQTAELETLKALLFEAKQAREVAETEAREWRSQLEAEKKELERQLSPNSLRRPWEASNHEAIDPEMEEKEATSSPASLDETSEKVAQKEPELHPKTPEMEQGDRQPMMVLKKQELAERLGVKQNTLNRPLNNGKFPEWSANKDPEGLQWERIGEGREARFVTYG